MLVCFMGSIDVPLKKAPHIPQGKRPIHFDTPCCIVHVCACKRALAEHLN